MLKRVWRRLRKRWTVMCRYARNHLASKNPDAYLRRARSELAVGAMTDGFESWQFRMEQILACPDMERIIPCEDAGRVWPGYQVMHNGVKVPLGSYYGPVTAAVFEKTRGVHEPQEEVAFEWLLAQLSLEDRPHTMVELGAYWAFYSAWFKSHLPNSRTILVEPIWEHMQFGRLTFELNGLDAESMRAFVGAEYADDARLPTVSLPWLFARYAIGTLDLLHCDIQGHETEMLQGAAELLGAGKVRTVFLSTHSDEKHAACREALERCGMVIAIDLPQADSYAYDGLIVATRAADCGLMEGVRLSRRTDVFPVDERGWKVG